jgi:hypothetical protein
MFQTTLAFVSLVCGSLAMVVSLEVLVVSLLHRSLRVASMVVIQEPVRQVRRHRWSASQLIERA